MDQVTDDAGKVIGAWRYDGVRDVWLAESVHQPGREHVAHSEAEAVAWIRELHAEETAG